MKILVTGASRGLGGFLAEGFAAAGHELGLLARSESGLKKIAGAIRSHGGRAEYFACDLTRAGDAEAAVTTLISLLGGVDVLVNAAGHVVYKGIFEMSSDEWRQTMAVNVDAAFYCTRAVAPAFRGQKHGHIINISSLSARIPLERGSAYSGSKHALNGFSKSMVHELHCLGIKVCTIFPGAFCADGESAWKMPFSEVLRSCEFVLGSHPMAFIEEILVRPLVWPE